MQTTSFNPNIPNLTYHLDYRIYSRPFRIPLHTHHGQWTERQGIILKLSTEQGNTSFGEIAPLPWFGSETLEQAADLCQTIGPFPALTDLLSIPTAYPASQFGIESAVESLQTAIANQPESSHRTKVSSTGERSLAPSYCHLLPTGPAALTTWQQPWSEGIQAFKWKIGINRVHDELKVLETLIQRLPSAATIRLDANGGLSKDMACQWLEYCDRLNLTSSSTPFPGNNLPRGDSAITATIEFLEQPMPPDAFDTMLELSHHYHTPIALDESVATLAQMKQCYSKEWRGIFVVKAAIAGSPNRLRRFCLKNDIDIVWSSVLETAIARQFITHHLIPTLPQSPRPIGFGVDQWFEPSPLDQTSPEALWNSCSN